MSRKNKWNKWKIQKIEEQYGFNLVWSKHARDCGIIEQLPDRETKNRREVDNAIFE